MRERSENGDSCGNRGRLAMRKRGGLVAALIALSMSAFASTAQGAIVTVGSPLTAAYAPSEYASPLTSFNTALAGPGANLTSPVNGVVIRWRIAGAEGGPFKLRVLTPGVANTYTGSGTSGGGLPTSTSVQTFATVLPIKAGQTIGLNNTNGTDKIGKASILGSSFGVIGPPLGEGATAAGTELTGEELAFNADIQPVPTITQLNPAAGSIVGGTSVAITGADFLDVKSVTFGGEPATSYTVDSPTQITATAPEVSRPRTVDVTITTIAGKSVSSPAGEFTYRACVVPRLTQKKLKAARKALKKAGCKLGKVTRKSPAGKNAKVTKQSVKQGTVRLPGSKVDVRVG